jgi:hypothetical protein
MALDPSIALGVRPLQLPDPLAQMAQVSQIKSGQQQQQLNQMKIEELIADRKELNDFAVKLQDQGITPRQYMEMLRSSRDPVNRKTGAEGLMRLDEQDKYGEVLKKIYPKLYESAPAAAPMVAAPAMGAPPVLPGALTPAAAAPMNALAPTFGPTPAAPVNALINQQSTPSQLEMNIAALAPFASRPGVKEQIAGFQSQLTELRKPLVAAAGSTIYGPSGQIIANVPAQQTELQRNYEYAKNQGFKGNIFDYERDIKFAGRAAATPAQPSAPVAVVDPVTGKQVYVSREEALRGKMTPAAAMESLPPKEIQKREAALPQATSAVKGFENKSDSFVSDLQKLRDHPGLSQITGIVAGRVPAVTADGRAAQALYDKVVAKGGFQALQDLRDASKTGGALGNVSNQEGKQLTASFSAIDRRQDAKDVKAAIEQAIGDVQGAKARMREAYDATYSYKSAAPATSNIDSLLDKYK